MIEYYALMKIADIFLYIGVAHQPHAIGHAIAIIDIDYFCYFSFG